MTAPAIEIAGLQSLPEFMAATGQLTVADRELIVDQALALIGEIYVHLPLKRAMHATDPVQRLRLLRRRLLTLSERRFHNEMIDIFTGLRDLHTNYVLPEPYRSKTAFLPFLIEEFWEGDQCQYVVSKVSETFFDPDFKPGAVITHWNSIPMERAVELNAERGAGSNPDARHARGLENMTIRPMAMSLPPDEHWADLMYISPADEGTRSIRIDWKVFSPETSGGNDLLSGLGREANMALGIDFLTESVRRTRTLLFAPGAVRLASQVAAQIRGEVASADAVSLNETSTISDVISFRSVTTAAGERVGYMRIWTFSVASVDRFIDEVVRILDLLPQDGLILDVRGNGGGIIMAGERLLQLFTPKEIQAERLQFINTPLTEALVRQDDSLAPWRESVGQAVETGTAFSQGFTIEPDDITNSRGQHYFGPVVLITDARCYSTTDIFAAGFQDHKIGQILGTAGNTGAGGANVWTHELLRSLLADTQFALKQLPRGSSMRVAVRRTTRVGENSGVPVEDLGIVPDQIHRMTRDDLFENNKDLIEAAAALLRTSTVRTLTGEVSTQSGNLSVKVATKNLDRVDVFGDRRPVLSIDVKDGTTSIPLPSLPRELRLEGYSEQTLFAIRRIPV